MKPKTIEEYDAEFIPVMKKFQDAHAKKDRMVEFYENSAVYPRRKKDPARPRSLVVNTLAMFADKNQNYVGRMPKFRVPPKNGGITPDDQMHASMLERLLYATHAANDTELLVDQWASDGTIMSDWFALVNYDLRARGVVIDRVDPRYAYYRHSGGTRPRLETFWVALPMSRREIRAQYDVNPIASSVYPDNDLDPNFYGMDQPNDDDEMFWCIWRWDDTNYCCWVGEQWLVAPHDHMYGEIPVERCVPFDSKKKDLTDTKYFLDNLLSLTAEFNFTLQGKSNYVDRSGKPLLVGTGVFGQDWEDVKAESASGEGGGAVGLMQGGDLKLLTPPEMKLQDGHLAFLFDWMKYITGFSDMSFGGLVGANTSGDALDMYSQPTAQATLRQWIKASVFFRNINRRILRYHEIFGFSAEEIQVGGHTFEPAMIQGYHESEVVPPSGTPRNELEEKRTAMEAANSGFIPKIQALEDAGYPDPQMLIEQLKAQNTDPSQNPEIMKQIAEFFKSAGGAPPGAPPAPNQAV